MSVSKREEPELAELQTRFAEALHYQPSEIAGHITEAGLSAEQRLQIYRNNFIISLTEVLEATYPAVKAVVGEMCFTALARQHILTTPSETGDVSQYGKGLDLTIQSQPDLHQAVPYLADLARLEWLVDRASLTTESGPDFPMAQLQGLTETRLATARLIPREHCWLLDSDFAVASLWLAIQANEFDHLDMTAPESAVVCPGPAVFPTSGAGTALVTMARQQITLDRASDTMLAALSDFITRQVFTRIFSGIQYTDTTAR
ncbi:putative DNA-binding domain-containing protein [Photobacterium sp. GJ3]|uniref:HvfC/BufC N-terminal domain-containing protein n=1 Tax=Photobacterium sp. GJ3 TaxID=2829502 RepID=UPI001B8C628E|nr:DNA-binding domain-containing protein [Photobacterium sp. GJ3]QUJ67412.1 putative DNA-binding domain-containing protein [Photobacterium sp. GJ3]